MVYESQQGSDSAWKPYFDVLPESFDTLMFWTENELQHLQGSAVLDKIGKKGADQAFLQRLLPVIRQHKDEFHAHDLSDLDLLALCHRMGSTIMAYAFDLERHGAGDPQNGEDDGDKNTDEEETWEEDSETGIQVLPKGMIPLADMLNADADLNNAKLFYQDEEVVMKTIKTVSVGEELFNDYGPLPRADVLRRYGYVTDNYAKYDVVEISLDLIKRAASDELHLSQDTLTDRINHLEDHTILDDAYDISREESESGEFPEELCMLLNILTTPQADFEMMKQKDKPPKLALSEKAQKLLHTSLDRRIAMYPTQQTGNSGSDADRRTVMASKVIQGEKTVLQEALKSTLSAMSKDGKRPADSQDDDIKSSRKSARTKS